MEKTIENKRRELIENVENEISKIEKAKTVFDVNFLEDCKNNNSIKDVYIIFGNKGLTVVLKETTEDLDFSYEDVVDFVKIKPIGNCSLQDFYNLNQDKKFVNSVIESLEKYKKRLIGLDSESEYDIKLYDDGAIPYSIATSAQRLYKIFSNRRYPRAFWESIWGCSFHNDQLPYIDSDNFRELLTEEAVRSKYHSKEFEKNLNDFLETVEELNLEDGLNDFFYSIVDVVSDWSW